MATYPIRQLADNGGTAQFVPVTAPEAVQFPDGSNLNALIGSIATIESNPVAANHAVGEFLCINGQVYEVIDTITAGDSIALGENVQVANLGSQITALNKGLTVESTTYSYAGGKVYFKRIGNVKTMYLQIDPPSTISTGTTWFTIPEQFRPIQADDNDIVDFTVIQTSGTFSGILRLNGNTGRVTNEFVTFKTGSVRSTFTYI